MNQIKNNEVLAGITWSLAEKILTDLVSSIISILLARFLFPEDYGLIAIVQIFITLSMSISSIGLDSALIQKKDASENQVSTVFTLSIIVGFFLYVVIFISAPLISRLYKNEQITNLIRILAIRIPLYSVYSMQHAYIKKRMEFKKFFFSSLGGTLIGGIVGVLMAIKGFGAWSLVGMNIIDQIIDSIVLYCATGWFPSFKLCIHESREMISYGMKILSSEIINKVYDYSSSLLIGIKYSAEDLAYNTKGNKLPYEIISVINSTVIRILFPYLANNQDEKAKQFEISSASVKITTFFVYPCLFGLAAISDTLVPFIYTEKWLGIIVFIKIFCIRYLFYPISTIENKIIESSGKAGILIKNQRIYMPINVFIVLITIVVSKNPIYIALEQIFTALIMFFVKANSCKKLIGYGIKEHFKDMFPSLFASLIMAMMVWPIKYIIKTPLMCIVTQVILGVIMYIGLSMLINNQIIKKIWIEIKKKRENENF